MIFCREARKRAALCSFGMACLLVVYFLSFLISFKAYQEWMSSLTDEYVLGGLILPSLPMAVNSYSRTFSPLQSCTVLQ